MEIQQYSDLAGEQAACGDIWMIQLWIGTKNRKTTLNDFGESLISYGSIANLFVSFVFLSCLGHISLFAAFWSSNISFAPFWS